MFHKFLVVIFCCFSLSSFSQSLDNEQHNDRFGSIIHSDRVLLVAFEKNKSYDLMLSQLLQVQGFKIVRELKLLGLVSVEVDLNSSFESVKNEIESLSFVVAVTVNTDMSTIPVSESPSNSSLVSNKVDKNFARPQPQYVPMIPSRTLTVYLNEYINISETIRNIRENPYVNRLGFQSIQYIVVEIKPDFDLVDAIYSLNSIQGVKYILLGGTNDYPIGTVDAYGFDCNGYFQ